MNTVSATFSIWSEVIEPQKISDVLGFQPDNTVIKGADRSSPRPRPTAFGWHVICREHDKVLAPEVLGHLIDRIEPFAAKISDLRNIDMEVSINFFLHISPKTADISLYIDGRIINRISCLNADLDIEFFD
jgi:hypothetical protein